MPDEPRPDDELPEDDIDPSLDGDDTVNDPDIAPVRDMVYATGAAPFRTSR